MEQINYYYVWNTESKSEKKSQDIPLFYSQICV